LHFGRFGQNNQVGRMVLLRNPFNLTPRYSWNRLVPKLGHWGQFLGSVNLYKTDAAVNPGIAGALETPKVTS